MQKLGLVVDSLQIRRSSTPRRSSARSASRGPRAGQVQARVAQADADREATPARPGGDDAEGGRRARHRDQAGAVPGRARPRRGRPGPGRSRWRDAEARAASSELEAERESGAWTPRSRKPADADAYRQRVEAEGRAGGAHRAGRGEQARDGAVGRGGCRGQVELAAAADAKRVELAATARRSSCARSGTAEAAATTTKGEAEGAARPRAAAWPRPRPSPSGARRWQKESDAVIGQQLAERLPEIVAAAARRLPRRRPPR